MNDRILSAAHRHLVPLVGVLSLILLWRGHNLPGGGFIGGLVATMAGVMIYLSSGLRAMMAAFRFQPETYLVLGLALAISSALWGALAGVGFFTALWLPAFYLPGVGKVLLGTPLLFDVGVFFVVLGFGLLVLSQMERMERWK